MIDEYIKDRAVPAARKTAKKAVQGTKNALASFGAGLSDWLRDFRWIEFSASVTAAFAAGQALASSLLLAPQIAYKVALFGAAVGAICYMRSPKNKWEDANAPDAPEN